MSRPTKARIDLGAIGHNYRYAKSLAPEARAVAIVKANGYGHGAVAVALSLANSADAFGVACTEEALELRACGITNPVLLLEGVFEPSELKLVQSHGFIPVIHNQEQLEWILGARVSRTLDVWLKMDSGMHRIGMAPPTFQAGYARLRNCPHVGTITLMTHFARADELDCPATRQQIDCFNRYAADIQAPRSLANSAAVLVWPTTHAQWIRPGIMLYGANPLGEDHPAGLGLRPTMTLESTLISIRDLEAGEPVGYGGRFRCDAPTRVGVVAAGYGDGYPRHARDGTPVAVKGHMTRIIGRVSMDMLTVDLTQVPDPRIGDRVELWGAQVPVNAVAAASDTISYQLFTGISRRIPMIHENAPE